MVKVSCENIGCRLCRRGECTAERMHIIYDDDGNGLLKVDCPEMTVTAE